MVPLNRGEDIGEAAAGIFLGRYPVWKIVLKRSKAGPGRQQPSALSHENKTPKFLRFTEGRFV